MWRKQGVLECFEVDSRLCHTLCTLSGLRPTTTLPSASPRPRHSKITKSDASYIPGQHNYQTQLHRTTPYHCRQHAHAGSRKRTRTLSAVALHAQSSLPQCSREFRNVITPPRKISYVITRQDDCHKLMFLRKGDQYFVTLSHRPWQ